MGQKKGSGATPKAHAPASRQQADNRALYAGKADAKPNLGPPLNDWGFWPVKLRLQGVPLRPDRSQMAGLDMAKPADLLW
jgi:hypothetical protein